MTRILITALAAFAALAVAAPASAKETTVHKAGYSQKTVEIKGAFNLDTPRGAERFASALTRAVAQACDTGDRTLAARRIERACVAETLQATVARLDKPYVTAALGQPGSGRFVIAAR